MANKLHIWTSYLSKMATASLIVLGFQIIIFISIFHGFVNIDATDPDLLIRPNPALYTALLEKSIHCHMSSPSALWLWWFSGLVGLWAIPQIFVALKLKKATFKVFQMNTKGGKELICQWLINQKRCMYLDLGLFVVLLISGYATGIHTADNQFSSSMGHFELYAVNICLFLVVCNVIRLICIGVVLHYNELLEAAIADATQKTWEEVLEETV